MCPPRGRRPDLRPQPVRPWCRRHGHGLPTLQSFLKHRHQVAPFCVQLLQAHGHATDLLLFLRRSRRYRQRRNELLVG